MEMGLRDVLSGVLNRYLPESRSKLVDSDIRGCFSNAVRACLSPDEEYLVRGSAGVGGRAQVPWSAWEGGIPLGLCQAKTP